MHQAQQHIFQMLEPGAPMVFRREVPDRADQVRRGQQLHRHRGQLRGLGARVPLPDERLRMGGEGVERVAGLVQQRHHIVHQADGVHEDERPPAEVQRLAVAARRLALPAVQVEQPLVDHGLELVAQRRIHPVEHATGPGRRIPPPSANGRSGAAR